jgi:hypothetical protein
MGDVGLVKPVVHPYAGGARGNPHGADYEIVDPDAFYLNPARAMAMTVIDLLCDDATRARAILEQSKPRFTKDGYLEFMRGLARMERFEG